jgi:hypothetical protein
VSHRFGLLDGRPVGDEGAGGGFEPAEFATIRAGMFGGQFLGLLLEQQLQGALGHSLGGGVSQLFHGPEIDLQTGASVAESPLGDNFSPPRCQLA